MGKEIDKVSGESKEITVIDERRRAVEYVGDKFGVADTVTELRRLMKGVTSEELNKDTVNAACNCVQNLNLTIKTAMQAARFLSGK